MRGHIVIIGEYSREMFLTPSWDHYGVVLQANLHRVSLDDRYLRLAISLLKSQSALCGLEHYGGSFEKFITFRALIYSVAYQLCFGGFSSISGRGNGAST